MTELTNPLPPIPEAMLKELKDWKKLDRNDPKKEPPAPLEFTNITVSVMSPEAILERSHGEVTKPETINYRSYKPEREGLFSEKIFGPTKDWECSCGKYRGMRYGGITCDRCGVLVTKKDVRRKWGGHIELAVPVVHIWFFKSGPSKIGYLLGTTVRDVERVIYYEQYIVIQPGKTGMRERELLNESRYYQLLEELGEENEKLEDNNPDKFIAMTGGVAIRTMLSRLDLAKLTEELHKATHLESNLQRKNDAIKRLKVAEAFKRNNELAKNKPEWMVLERIPVIPPDLRPLVPLEGGRFATSDLNDLYRRVIIRNNRLRRLIAIKAPDVILRNEKRMLQEAVDSLFDNGRKNVEVRGNSNRPLKSLSDNLRGKSGRFRQNLLGKRVDYSGRSVIVVGPELKMHQCGLPKELAIELFTPFVIRKLIEREYVKTVKTAKRMVQRREEAVWAILEEIIQDHPVLLNRAPTLHRLGIQAFQPVLIEGKAIRLHPLVCAAFNADFDGDQMAVHVPLSFEAQLEARLLMLASGNLLHPANGRPITVPSQDMILGCYYLTKKRTGVFGENRFFADEEDVIMAYNNNIVHMNAQIYLRRNGEYVDTTVGRVIFNRILPEEIRIHKFFNSLLTKAEIQDVIQECHNYVGTTKTAQFLDRLKELGFNYAMRGGLSVSIWDIEIPKEKEAVIENAWEEVKKLTETFEEGLIGDTERYNNIIDTWTHATNEVAQKMMEHLAQSDQGFNPVYMMAHSGARGSRDQIRQLAGMRGLMQKPMKTVTGGKGEIIENPIVSNFREGLTVLEYFISTHGARKGLADTALKTADAGYLTRRLVDVAQDVIIRIEDCGTTNGITVEALEEGQEVSAQLFEKIVGRTLADNIYDPVTNEILVPSKSVISAREADIIARSGVEHVMIRSVLTCDADFGVCRLCYGTNLTTSRLVDIGEAVGVIAAQSIGEPGTQLTLRTFHTGGTVARQSAQSEVYAKAAGQIVFENVFFVSQKSGRAVVVRRNGLMLLIDENNRQVSKHNIPYGAELKVADGDIVDSGALLFVWDPYSKPILSTNDGYIHYIDLKEDLTYKEMTEETTKKRYRVIIEPRDKKLSPHIVLLAAKGDPQTRKQGQYVLPVGARLMKEEGDFVEAGTEIARVTREGVKAKDITGGLPRVQELFEARKPRDPAIIAEIDGIVRFGGIRRGVREVVISSLSTSDEKKYMLPVTRDLLVFDGDFVRAGDPMTEGPRSPSDILKVLGHSRAREFLVNEILAVYAEQGVKINPKHVEVIVRQMMQKVRIMDPGDTEFLEGDTVNRQRFERINKALIDVMIVTDPGDTSLTNGQQIGIRELRRENQRTKKAGGTEAMTRDAIRAQWEPVLLGITQAALTTESFLSAASFQETTRVLTDAAVERRIDHLNGLKENIIMGHIIPAGTGMSKFRNIIVENDRSSWVPTPAEIEDAGNGEEQGNEPVA
ncbi:MAG: DNA-directed RNA polymerase subunit beta' [bacterium]|nr:DNA-directed RNA polymerase subunit beta' [bacterium]